MGLSQRFMIKGVEKKKVAAVVLSILFIIGLSGCASSSGLVPAAPGKGKKRIISIATVQPEDHPISIGLKAFQDYIQKELGEEFEIKIYFNGIMGDNGQALELLQMGTLDLVATSGSNLESFDDTYKIFGLPYLFEDEEHFRTCMKDDEFVTTIYDCTVRKGIQGVAWFANGVNNIYSSKPIRTPDDIKGIKLRIQSSEANVKMAQQFGAAAVVMAYGEVYTAMQNHVIDAAMNPEMALISMKHGEVAKYYSRTEHQIFTDVMVANVDFMNSLDDQEKKVMEEGFRLCTDVEVKEWDRQIVDCIKEAEAMGVEFIEVDKTPFEELQKPVREELLKSYPQLQPLHQRILEIQEKQENQEIQQIQEKGEQE
ncbi:TRAP transporter substrate-binding protein [Clostridium sp. AM58-1XD]|nr:TRAP transporter substrate-binding protein [Clostridium sp. AM58-1XD]